MSFTRRPGSENLHIVRNAHVQPTASSAAIQAQVAPSLEALCLHEPNEGDRLNKHLGNTTPITCAALDTHPFAHEEAGLQRNGIRVSQDCFRTPTTLPWPARTPYLSPIELIWDHLGRRVGHPRSLNELESYGLGAILYHRHSRLSRLLSSLTHANSLLPAYSPDMSPIEHVWDLFDQRLACDLRPAVLKEELLLRIQAIWNSLLQADIQNMFYSMPSRMAEQTLIAVSGG
ncbi:transposable element Tcb1 transposase [Trichonephila clavipes]|uniref:Transposable element Tcb1 transposase n=1 Tax=Trichonephila clavipes TaxID=2585209 RepID=A0A8X6VUI1_TRICX|nr:transposable element Tcb1 transposase [Trichonephila clavipes]